MRITESQLRRVIKKILREGAGQEPVKVDRNDYAYDTGSGNDWVTRDELERALAQTSFSDYMVVDDQNQREFSRFANPPYSGERILPMKKGPKGELYFKTNTSQAGTYYKVSAAAPGSSSREESDFVAKGRAREEKRSAGRGQQTEDVRKQVLDAFKSMDPNWKMAKKSSSENILDFALELDHDGTKLYFKGMKDIDDPRSDYIVNFEIQPTASRKIDVFRGEEMSLERILNYANSLAGKLDQLIFNYQYGKSPRS